MPSDFDENGRVSYSFLNSDSKFHDLISSIRSWADQSKRSGFAYLGFSGFYVVEQTYRKDGQLVSLVPMVHVAKSEFFDSLAERELPGRTIVLLEGLQDRNKLFEGRDFVAFREAVVSSDDLVVQPRALRLHQAQHNEQSTTKTTSRWRQDIRYRNGDLDVSDFSQETIEYLRAATDVREWKDVTPSAAVNKEIVDKRSGHVVDLIVGIDDAEMVIVQA